MADYFELIVTTAKKTQCDKKWYTIVTHILDWQSNSSRWKPNDSELMESNSRMHKIIIESALLAIIVNVNNLEEQNHTKNINLWDIGWDHIYMHYIQQILKTTIAFPW